MWRKERKGKKGVMQMIKSQIKVINIEYGKGKAELIRTQIKIKCGESQNIVVAYVTQKVKIELKKNLIKQQNIPQRAQKRLLKAVQE